MTLRIHYLQHVEFEGLGYIEEWCREKGYILSATRFYLNDFLPDKMDFDCLVVMGGPMGVYDFGLFPWLAEEQKFIRQAIERRKKVLGICLGSQLIASAMGARVYPNVKKEIGWFPVQPNDSFSELSNYSNDSLTVFHWHGDTFDLPAGAVNHVTSLACKHQLFTIDQSVMGIQFHFEATTSTINSMMKNCGHELIKDDYIQTKDEILKGDHHISRGNEILSSLLNKFLS